MTHTLPSAVASAPADDSRVRASSTGRLTGLDLARGPAILRLLAGPLRSRPVHGRPARQAAGDAAWPLGDAAHRMVRLFALTRTRVVVLYPLHTATEPARLIT